MIPPAPSLNRVRTKKGAIESFFAELGELVDDAPTVTLGVVPAARGGRIPRVRFKLDDASSSRCVLRYSSKRAASGLLFARPNCMRPTNIACTRRPKGRPIRNHGPRAYRGPSAKLGKSARGIAQGGRSRVKTDICGLCSELSSNVLA